MKIQQILKNFREISKIFVLVNVFMFLFFYDSAFPWGSLTGANTHGLINNEAYNAMKSNTYISKYFPHISKILEREGVYITGVGGPLGNEYFKGPGPDSEGSTVYSEHYYNPRTGKGDAPASVKKYFIYLAKSNVAGGKTNELGPKSAAWAAHFLADMFVPYHVVGMPATDANTLRASRITPVKLSVNNAGDINSLGSGTIIGGTEKNKAGDFTEELDRFLKVYVANPHVDWFDPWYWNGWSFAKGETSTHLGWEAWAHNQIGGAYSFSGFYPLFKNAAPSFVAPIENQAIQIEEMTKLAADETVSKTKDYIIVPQRAIDRAITAVLTMWRASYSALEPNFSITEKDKKWIIEGRIKNNEPNEQVEDVKMQFEINKGDKREIDQLHIGNIPAGSESGLLTVDIDPEFSGDIEVRIRVIGKYEKTPDLQYAEQHLKSQITHSCVYQYSDWSPCDPKTKKQTRKLLSKSPQGCTEKEKPLLERNCEPDMRDKNKQIADKLWNECIELAKSNQFERALQKCEESLTYWADDRRIKAVDELRERKEKTTQVDKEQKTEKPSCTYEYSDWGECSRATKTQKRRVIAKKPDGCEERQKPVLEQGCTPPPTEEEKRNQYFNCICRCSSGWAGHIGVWYDPEEKTKPECKSSGPCIGGIGAFGCSSRHFFAPPNDCAKACWESAFGKGTYDPEKADKMRRDENKKYSKPLTVKLTASKNPADFGDVIDIRAQAAEGTGGYTYNWSGCAQEAKDNNAKVTFKDYCKSCTASVTVTDQDGNSASDSLLIQCNSMKVKLSLESPKEKTLPIGSKANLIAEVLSGDKPASGTFYYQWQPHPEVVFGDPKNLVPETTGGAQSRNTALFKRTGNFKIWVDVFKEIEGRKVKVGESEQIPINVVNPKLNLKVSKTDPLVGDKVVVTVQEEPKMSDEFVSFWWEYSGSLDNPGPEPNIPNSRAYSFKPKDTKPVTITVHGKAKDGGDDLGEAKTTITAKSYQVSISQPRYLGPKPRIWKCDTQLGGACPGLVEVADTQFAVFRDIFMKATVTPTPESPRYRWTVDPTGSCGFPGAGDEIKLNCSQTGTYTVKVEVTNPEGVKLGEATQTFTVSISDEMLKQADKSKQAYDKVQQAKQLVGQGKLDEAISFVQEAVSLDPTNQEAKSLSDKWKNERDGINKNIENINKFITEKKFADAEKELTQAKALHPKYAKVLEAEKRLNEERNKKQRADQLWNECIALTKQNRHAEALGKCKESLNISPDEKRRQAVAQLEQEVTKKQKADELWSECVNLAKSNRLNEAIAKCEESIRYHSKEDRLRALSELKAQAAKAQQEAQNKQTADKLWNECISLAKGNRLNEAISRCEQSLSYWSSEDRQRAYNQLKSTLQKTNEENKNKQIADKIWNECIELARQKNYEQAWRKCDESLKYWRNDQRIEATVKLKEEARRVTSSTTQPPSPPPLPPVSTEPPVRDYTYQSPTDNAKSQVIFNNGNISGVYNNPTRPTVFTINQPHVITLIQNYHWNNARGSTPGTIALRDQIGRAYGPWKAQGSPGQGGVPNAYWTVYPNITLPAGTYTVIDSEPSTWAQNSGSGGAGHTRIEGYPVSERVNQQGTVNVQQGGTINNVQWGATLNAEITNASRENVHIFIEGQDTFGPHNRVTPGERKTLSIKAPAQGGFINFVAGRNGQILTKCRWEYVPEYRNRVPVVRFSDPNILSCSTGIR